MKQMFRLLVVFWVLPIGSAQGVYDDEFISSDMRKLLDTYISQARSAGRQIIQMQHGQPCVIDQFDYHLGAKIQVIYSYSEYASGPQCKIRYVWTNSFGRTYVESWFVNKAFSDRQGRAEIWYCQETTSSDNVGSIDLLADQFKELNLKVFLRKKNQ